MKRWSTPIVIGVILSLLLAACLPPPDPTPTPTAPVTEVKIDQPTEGAKIETIATIKGTSQMLPDESVIWAVVFLPATGRYYPQNYPADVQANGNWAAVINVGQEGESGLQADILAVVADASAQDIFNTYLTDARDKKDFPGLERLPDGALIYHRISVVRQ